MPIRLYTIGLLCRERGRRGALHHVVYLLTAWRGGAPGGGDPEDMGSRGRSRGSSRDEIEVVGSGGGLDMVIWSHMEPWRDGSGTIMVPLRRP